MLNPPRPRTVLCLVPAVRYTDPDLFDLHCPRCGYTVTGLAGSQPACPECGHEIYDWRAVERAAERRSLIKRAALIAFLVAPLGATPVLYHLDLKSVRPSTGLVMALGVALCVQVTLAAVAAWPTRAGTELPARLIALGKALLASLAYLTVVWSLVRVFGWVFALV